MTNIAAAVDRPAKCPNCDWAPPATRTVTVSWLSLAKHLRAAHSDWPAVKSAHRAAHAAARSAPSRQLPRSPSCQDGAHGPAWWPRCRPPALTARLAALSVVELGAGRSPAIGPARWVELGAGPSRS